VNVNAPSGLLLRRRFAPAIPRPRLAGQDFLWQIHINARAGHLQIERAVDGEHGIAAQGLSTSSFRTTWLLDRSRLDEAVRLVHAEFLEK